MDKVIEFIKNNIQNNDTLVVATSGGPDSMCLLDILVSLNKENNYKIVVAHVNHNVRKESEREKELVHKYCNDNNLSFEYFKIEEKINKNFEMEARKIRYEFFENIITKYNAKYLLTAHHGDDLVETVLMRINRGSILKGYRGILPIYSKIDYKILRPLLYVTKDQILNYLEDNNISYAIDDSNQKPHHTRNRYRKNILPELKKENENTHLKFIEFANELDLYNTYIDKVILDKWPMLVMNNKIDCIKFNLEDDLIKVKVLEKYLDNIFDGFLEVITKKHVNNILKMINNNISNTKIDLPNDYVAFLEYNKFEIRKNVLKNDIIEKEIILTDDIELENGCIKFVDDNIEKSNFVIRLNSKDITLPLKIRYRKNGDRMNLKNSNHSKKINDIFTDEKISNELRDTIPILVDSQNEIIWIPGIKKSNFDKEIKENYDIIIKYIKKGGK